MSCASMAPCFRRSFPPVRGEIGDDCPEPGALAGWHGGHLRGVRWDGDQGPGAAISTLPTSTAGRRSGCSTFQGHERDDEYYSPAVVARRQPDRLQRRGSREGGCPPGGRFADGGDTVDIGPTLPWDAGGVGCLLARRQEGDRSVQQWGSTWLLDTEQWWSGRKVQLDIRDAEPAQLAALAGPGRPSAPEGRGLCPGLFVALTAGLPCAVTMALTTPPWQGRARGSPSGTERKEVVAWPRHMRASAAEWLRHR